MAVFTYRIMDELYGVVRRTASELLSDTTVTLSPDEFIATFVRAEHVQPLKTTEELVGIVGETTTSTKIKLADGNKAHIYIRFRGAEPPIIMPPYINDGPNPDAPEPVIERITAYANERVRLGRIFGDALDSLHYLNDSCGNAPAMAVLFPCLPALFTAAGKHTNDPDSQHFKRAARIREAKSFGNLPRLLPEVRDRMKTASTLLQNVMMLDKAKASEEPQYGYAVLSVTSPELAYNDFIYESLGQAKDASFV